MSILGCRIFDIPDTYGWDGLFIMTTQAPENSALNRALYPDIYSFGTAVKQSAILADIFNAMSMFRYEFASANSQKRKPKKPQLYPTPWTKDDSNTIGKGAIPLSQFDDWYYSEDIKE